VIGFAFAVNGELNSADIYANSILFKKLWPKMLESCAVEALSEKNDGKKIKETTAKDLTAWLEQAEKGREKKKNASDKVHMRVKESEKDAVFETYSDADKMELIHMNIMSK